MLDRRISTHNETTINVTDRVTQTSKINAQKRHHLTHHRIKRINTNNHTDTMIVTQRKFRMSFAF